MPSGLIGSCCFHTTPSFQTVAHRHSVTVSLTLLATPHRKHPTPHGLKWSGAWGNGHGHLYQMFLYFENTEQLCQVTISRQEFQFKWPLSLYSPTLQVNITIWWLFSSFISWMVDLSTAGATAIYHIQWFTSEDTTYPFITASCCGPWPHFSFRLKFLYRKHRQYETWGSITFSPTPRFNGTNLKCKH